MTTPLVRRQILSPVPPGTTSSQTLPSPTTLPSSIRTTTTSTTGPPSVTGIVSLVTSIVGPAFSTSASQPTPSTPVPPSPSLPVSSVSPTTTPPFSATGSNGLVTVTQTTPDTTTTPASGGSSESKGKTFLQNKPLSGFVFGLAGLAALILVFIVVTSIVRRRNRKRLLADASTFSFDPRDVEDGTSDEKHSHAGLTGHGNIDYPPDSRVPVGFVGVGTGSISRPGPVRSPPMPAYAPREYVGYDGGYPAQYHNQGNAQVGYSPTHNTYDMYDPRDSGRYPNNQGQHDPYYFPGSNGDGPVMTNPSVPRQLQPGIRPAQGPTFLPPSSLQPSAPDYKDLPRLPTPGALPDTFGRQNSVGDFEDDAHGGAYLGPESPPEHRTLQVANM
ncbi:hypothetical protein BJ322DRAFT_1110738 [Thelephora terrestris]|uniref:Transmembrane protein n=1 Tax=Thelephora terrestris TaxID=56493 RepID=A0A9P6HA87_9AGAM|nr:hypothetical protein BJ322DRAFT_1110738 [Thelephora terrestris]